MWYNSGSNRARNQPRSQALETTLARNLKSDFEIIRLITPLIIYMQKCHHADWLRARQLIPNSAES